MNFNDLYKKCTLDVYANYFKYLNCFNKSFDKEKYIDLMNEYNIFCEWYKCNVFNFEFYDDIVNNFYSINGVNNLAFDELIEIHFINETIKSNYFKLKDLKTPFILDFEFNLFYKNILNILNKRISEFTLYKKDDKLDFFAEELCMKYNINISNKYSILNKITELVSIVQILFKYKIIDDEDYFEFVNIYQDILMDDSLKVSSYDLIELFNSFDNMYNSIEKKYELKKKIKN